MDDMFPNGYLGLAKFFSRKTTEAAIATGDDELNSKILNLSRLYFKDLGVLSHPEAAAEFHRVFGEEKFVFSIIESEVSPGSGKFIQDIMGPYPDYIAEIERAWMERSGRKVRFVPIDGPLHPHPKPALDKKL